MGGDDYRQTLAQGEDDALDDPCGEHMGGEDYR
jgi:hypothetical protein